MPPVAGTVALWVLQVLLAGVFVMAALPKVSADPIAVAGFDLLGLGTPGMIIVPEMIALPFVTLVEALSGDALRSCHAGCTAGWCDDIPRRKRRGPEEPMLG